MSIAAITAKLIKGFNQSEEGSVAVVCSITAAALVLMVFGAIDYGRSVNSKVELQAALDAAALRTARTTEFTDPDTKLQEVGSVSLSANLSEDRDWSLKTLSFKGDQEGQAVVAEATATVRTSILGYLDRNEIAVGAASRVKRSSKNVEVSLVLDVTGSMAGQKLSDLKAAAEELIDIVVKENQEPYYSKVAIVPYSMGVNVGNLAADVRGNIIPPRAISGATRANPVVITSTGHGFTNGSRVFITGLSGMTQLNNRLFTVTSATVNTFALQGVDGRNFNAYASGGTASCTVPGCEYYAFTNANGGTNVHRVSTCVTERSGTNAYSDAAPSVARLGRNYPSASNRCLANAITPLSSDRSSLSSRIDDLSAGGSTAGHIGLAWGWYLLSPNFASILPTDSQPADYEEPDVLKVVVLMTDGEYNSAYCNGVIAQDSSAGSGSRADQIACNSPNGSSFSQALELCTSIKNTGVTLFTVGLDVVDDPRARNLVNTCATDSSHVYLPSTGAALKSAFRSIAVGIDQLRIAG